MIQNIIDAICVTNTRYQKYEKLIFIYRYNLCIDNEEAQYGHFMMS